MKRRIILMGVGLLVALLLAPGAEQVTALPPHQAECFLFPIGTGPEEACAFGVFLPSPISGNLGEAVLIPEIRYVNNTDRDMTFTVEWTGSNPAGWGPVLIHEATLDPQTEATFTDVPLVPHELMQIGRNIGDIGWSVQGGDYVATVQQPYEFLLFHDDFIAVPVRWCAIEGSPQAGDQEAGETISGSKLLGLLRRANDEIWTPSAHIVFRSAVANGIPVIADPQPPEDAGDQLGDVDAGFLTSEPQLLQMACEQAWAAHAPDERGMVLVNVRKFVRSAALGIAPAPDKSLWVESRVPGTGERGDDLCGQPRNLLVSDVTPEYVAVTDLFFEDRASILAHELGHALLLGHGNGLDDNQDGLEPPQPGPRRYDEYCDPLWLAPPDNTEVAEDLLTDPVSCEVSSSLMNRFGSCPNLRPLQVETARAVARLVPGALFDATAGAAAELVAAPTCDAPPCDLPPDVFITRVEMATSVDSAITSFSHTVFGALPPGATNEYLVFADLDNDPATGCAPAAPDFPTAFQGAELVTSVQVEQAGDVLPATPAVWQCQGGALVPVSDPGIRGAAYTQLDALEGQPLFSVIAIHVPDAVRGPAGDEVRLQAVARQMGAGGEIDRLPAETDGGGALSLRPPSLTGCSLAPSIVNPGGTTTLTAEGLPAGGTAEVYLGDQLIATGAIDGGGAAQFDVIIPGGSRQGARPVSVLAAGTTANAVCGVLVDGPSLAPATAAAASPASNAAGWNNSDVTLTLSATGATGGDAIRDITYSAAGAQTIPATTIPGATTEVTLDAEGQTTLTFFATDEGGNSEPPQTITISIDKTPPTITGAVQRVNNRLTVSFTCADALSGILFCSGPTTLPVGANQSVTGEATDMAGNSASSTVGGIDNCPLPGSPAHPPAEMLHPRLAGAFIELQAEPLRPNLWTRIQWLDAAGRWHDIEGWQGSFNPNRRVLWFAGPEILGQRPFRWLVYENPVGQLLGVSRPFALPGRGGQIQRVSVTLGGGC